MYKQSIFNFYIKHEDAIFLWNSYSGAIAKIGSEEVYFLQNPNVTSYSANKLLPIMINNGFIVSAEKDEYQDYINMVERNYSNPIRKSLYYVIAPTLACNYKCVYCFENDREIYDYMSEKTSDDVEKFILSNINKISDLKYLHVNWFGGEPLLCPAIIQKISTALISACQKQSIIYNASIVTNGRYLSKKNAELLSLLKISKVQISFDGTEKIYCRRKRASLEDYHKTLENIVIAADILKDIVIRINIEQNQFDDAYRLAEILLSHYKLDGKISLYLAYTNEGSQEERIKNYSEFVKGEQAFIKQFGTKYSYRSYHYKSVAPKLSTCGLIRDDQFCIGPNGELYKCEHHFGIKDYIVGTIYKSKMDAFLDTYKKARYLSLHKEECRTCPAFPVCLGGCPNHILLNQNLFDCETYRKYLCESALRSCK